MSTGQKIIDAIISGRLIHAECADDKQHPCIIIWSSGAAEQLDAIIAETITTNGAETTP